VILHGLDLDGAKTGSIGDGRARHTGKNHRAHDVDVGQAAAGPARNRHREVVDAVGDPGGIHQVAGQDEKGHGQQREAVHAARHAVQNHEVRNAGDEVGIDQGRGGKRDEDRQAGKQHQEKDEDDERHGEAFAVSVGAAIRR
jgi:hypothetical protein